MEERVLLDHLDKIHTTQMGVDRIRRNLKLDTADVVEYCNMVIPLSKPTRN